MKKTIIAIFLLAVSSFCLADALTTQPSGAALVGKDKDGRGIWKIYMCDSNGNTTSVGVHITITANSGSVFHQILPSPGKGLRIHILQWNMGISGGCTGTNTVLSCLASNGVDVPGSMYTPYTSNNATLNPGGWTSPTEFNVLSFFELWI